MRLDSALRIASMLALTLLWECASTQPPADAAPDVVDAALDRVLERPDAALDTDLRDASERETVIRVHYPAGAHRITLRGSAGPWTWSRGVPADLGAQDTWTYRTTAITEVTEWKPLLDDETWSRGPNYRVAPGQTVDVYPHFVTTAGRVIELFASFHSNVLGNDRRVWAYLPPTYLENTRATFPVVYMQDGQNLFDPGRAFGGNEWQVDETIDRAAEDGSFAEAIVIGPENTSERIYEYTPTRDDSVGEGGGLRLYLRMVVEELEPAVDAMLRTRRGAENTAIVGSSLGGLVAAYGGLWYPERFGLLGVMSPSTWWDNERIIADVRTGAGTMPRALRVYVDSGDSGPSNDDVERTARLARTYRDVGYVEGRDLHYVVQMGAVHSEVYWAQRLPGALRFLLGPRQP